MSHTIMTDITNRIYSMKAVMPEWWPILLGLLVMYAPTFYDLFNGLWATEEQMHGPIILALAIWLMFRLWPNMIKNCPIKSASVSGWAVFVIALLFYIVGRSQQIILFEMLSLIWMLAAILLIKYGSSALKFMWFPLFFMLFMIPLPGTVVIVLTMPMKMADRKSVV